MQSLLSYAVNLLENSIKSVYIDKFDVSSSFITERMSDSDGLRSTFDPHYIRPRDSSVLVQRYQPSSHWPVKPGH